MSRSGRPDDVDCREAAEVLRDHIDLVLDAAIQQACSFTKMRYFSGNQGIQQILSADMIWNRPLDLALQSRYADCRCSPFGRLVRKSCVISGSGAEGLVMPRRPPKFQDRSDVDIMTELSLVHWTFPGSAINPVEDTAAEPAIKANAVPRDQDTDPTPRLVIAETENPGFVLVLQERRDDCPHQEQRPFKSEDVTRSFTDHQLIACVENISDTSINGPACSFVLSAKNAFFPSDYDMVPCLHVPVWWFSDEFFTRHRRYNWPSKNMLDDIKRYGLHLVPVGAPGSSTEKLEWRLSFSRAEVEVASDLTDLQRCAVVAFKICKTALGKNGKMIKSYFIKTALLWLCEQTPTEDWKSVTHGVLMLLDYLDEAVSKRNLPCFFWSRINLLRFVSRADRKVMRKALKTIRQHYISLLTHEVCVFYPRLQKMLSQQTRRPSERQLRACLTRWLITRGIADGIIYHMMLSTSTRLDELLPVLVRSYTTVEVRRLLRTYGYSYHVQTQL